MTIHFTPLSPNVHTDSGYPALSHKQLQEIISKVTANEIEAIATKIIVQAMNQFGIDILPREICGPLYFDTTRKPHQGSHTPYIASSLVLKELLPAVQKQITEAFSKTGFLTNGITFTFTNSNQTGLLDGVASAREKIAKKKDTEKVIIGNAREFTIKLTLDKNSTEIGIDLGAKREFEPYFNLHASWGSYHADYLGGFVSKFKNDIRHSIVD